MPTVHISANKEDIAKTVIMPGDPKRAEFIAKNYLKDYKLVNTTRAMLAYTGYYKDKLITVFASGMGIPSMGIYSYELFSHYDVDNIIRIGSAGGYQTSLKLNDIVLVETSYSASTYGKIMMNYEENNIKSSSKINEIIESTASSSNINIIKGNVNCSDVFYSKNNNYKELVDKYNILCVEMETFSLFCNAASLGKNATAILTISDLVFSEEVLTPEEREQKLTTMIELSLNASLKL